MNYFKIENSVNLRDNNLAARQAALLDGSLHSFTDICEKSDNDRYQKCHTCHHTGTQPYTVNGIETQQNWNQKCHACAQTGTQPGTVNGTQYWNQKCHEHEHDETCRNLKHCLPTVQVSEGNVIIL